MKPASRATRRAVRPAAARPRKPDAHAAAPAAAPAGPPRDLASLRRIFDLASDGFLYTDARRRVRFLNDPARRMLDMPARWAVGRPASEVLRTAVPVEDLLGEARRGRPGTRETLLLTRAGHEVPARVTTVRLPTGAACAVLQDLTQAQRVQRELRLRERLATVGELAAGVAHEIRNPLAGISSSAQVLLTRFEPRDDRQKFCRVIIEQVDRLDRTITSLLKFARPPEPQLRPAQLDEVVDRVFTLEGERLAEARIEVERQVAPRVPAVFIDPGLIEQVVLNLVINAVQAMPSGGTLRWELALATRRAPAAGRSRGRRMGDMVVRAGRGPASSAARQGEERPAAERRSSERIGDVPAPRRVVRFRLIDTGVGIPREVLPRLFDPFFTTRAGGTGLGLSISQSILQEHGGAISIASREGRGTTVVIELPLEKRHGQRRQGAR